MMKKILPILFFVFGLTQITKAQVITCVPCNQLGMVMNVGSQQTAISIYHSGQYMTHPRSQNIFTWEFSDQHGNILHQDTLVDASTISFGHSWSLTDTIDVNVRLVNDSAILPSGNSINCLFEDQIYWSTDASTPWGVGHLSIITLELMSLTFNKLPYWNLILKFSHLQLQTILMLKGQMKNML